MCGLVGIMGSGIIAEDAKIFKQLLFIDSLRGHHSTGVAGVTADGGCEVFKKAVDGPDFLQLKTAKDIIADAPKMAALLGHNRHATKGGISSDTAHPFEHGGITLMHNGTLHTQVGLPEHTKFSVDSENICYALSVQEPQEVLSGLDGAFALVWHDARNSTINFIRNDQRPLWFAAHKSRMVTYYASERKMLEAILERNDVSVDYIELQTETLVTLPVDGIKVGKAEAKKIELMDTHYGYYYGGGFGGGYGKTKSTKKAGRQGKSSVTGFVRSYQGINEGDEVEVYFTNVIQYQGTPTQGTLIGYSTESPFLEVKQHSSDSNSLAGIYLAKVKGFNLQGEEATMLVKDAVLSELIQGDGHNKGKEKEVAALAAPKKT